MNEDGEISQAYNEEKTEDLVLFQNNTFHMKHIVNMWQSHLNSGISDWGVAFNSLPMQIMLKHS